MRNGSWWWKSGKTKRSLLPGAEGNAAVVASSDDGEAEGPGAPAEANLFNELGVGHPLHLDTSIDLCRWR